MAETVHSKILWRMTGRSAQGGDDRPMTASRATRLAVTKAADDSVGLAVTIADVDEDMRSLDDVLTVLDDDLMLVELRHDEAIVGLIALDMQLRAAVLEMQTIGSLIAMAAEPRPATATDKTMCDPLFGVLLKTLPTALAGSELEGWIEGCNAGRRISNVRAVGLALPDCDYRVLHITMDLGVADRQGRLFIALPPIAQPETIAPEAIDGMGWGAQFHEVAANAPAMLAAQLYKFSIPLACAQSLEVGQVLPMTGCDVHSVRLLSLDGKIVAQAKLGQLGGMRAVRIEKASPLKMTELPPATRETSKVVGRSEDAKPLALDAGDPVSAQTTRGTNTGGAELPKMLGKTEPAHDARPATSQNDDFAAASTERDALSAAD